jgi:hypothetical protein
MYSGLSRGLQTLKAHNVHHRHVSPSRVLAATGTHTNNMQESKEAAKAQLPALNKQLEAYLRSLLASTDRLTPLFTDTPLGRRHCLKASTKFCHVLAKMDKTQLDLAALVKQGRKHVQAPPCTPCSMLRARRMQTCGLQMLYTSAQLQLRWHRHLCMRMCQ